MSNDIENIKIKEKENLKTIMPNTSGKARSFIEKQLFSIKEKTNLMTDTITNKLFDTNLLTVLREDLHILNDDINELRKQNNEIIKSEVFLFQILDNMRKEINKKYDDGKFYIEMPLYIKNHFRIDS